MKGTIPGTTIQSHVEDNLQSELVVLRQRIQELEAEAGERNRVEQGMERAAREWRTTFDAIADMVSIHNENFRILRVNKAFASYFGLKPKEVLGKTCHELMHGDRVPCKGCPHLKTMQTGESTNTESYNPHLGMHTETSCSPILDDEGRVTATVHIMRDITQRKRAEEDVNKFKTIADNASYGVGIVDLDGKFTYTNESYARMHGYTTDDMTGQHYSMLYTQEQLKTPNRLIRRAIEKGNFSNEEVWHRRKDGSIFPTLMNSTVVKDDKGKPLYLSATTIDITERKRMEEALRESEQRYISAERIGQFGHWRRNFADDKVIWSVGTYRLFGVSPEHFQPTKENVPHLVHPDDRESMQRQVEEFASQGKRFDLEFRIIRPDGAERTLHSVADVNYDQAGLPQGLFGTIVDVTEPKKAEEALRESEHKFRSLAEQSPNMIFINRKGRVVYANQKCEELMGYQVDDFYAPDFDFLNLIAPESMDLLKESFVKHMKGEEVPPVEYSLLAKDGRRIEAILATKLVEYQGETAILGTVTDITERKRAEENVKKFKAIADNASYGVSMSTLDGEIIYVNASYARMHQYTQDELIGRHFSELYPEDQKAVIKGLRKQLYKNDNYDTTEVWHRKKDGTAFPTLMTGSMAKNDKGEPFCMSGTTIDITDRKQAEEALRESEERYRDLFENANDLIQSVGIDGRFIYVNRAWREKLGYSEEEVAALDLWDIIHPDCISSCQQIFQKVLSGETIDKIEAVFITKDGRPVTVEGNVNCRAIGDKSVATRAIFRDVTERRQAEEDIRKFKTITDLASYGALITDMDGKIIYANDACARMHGYNIDELINQDFSILYPPEHVEEVKQVRKHIIRGESFTGELLRRKKDGTLFPTIGTGIITKDETGKPLFLASVMIDITERKRAEEEIRKFKTIADLAPYGVVLTDIKDGNENGFIYVNESYAKMHGYTADELVGKHYSVTVPQEQLAAVRQNSNHCISTGRLTYEEIRKVRKDGTVFPVLSTAQTVRDDSGKPAFIAGIIIDITEIKQAEEETRKFKAIADNADYGVSISEPKGRIVYLNQAYAQMHGYTLDETIGQEFTILYPKEQAKIIWERRERILKTGNSVDELWHQRKDGTVFPTLSTGTAVKDDQGNIIYIAATHIDISERKKMEEQLIVTDRLASLGELAAGIAHEINNPLTSIIGYSDLLMAQDIGNDVHQDLEVLNRESKRAAQIVRNLLAFARKHQIVRERLDINQLIEMVLELRGYEQKVNNILVDAHFAGDLPEIMADSFRLQQVFLNLIINAEYFMIDAHGQGTLTISTELAGDFIRVSFADDGPGIAAKHIGHLFDPFFTTKEVGKGTGLGLSICHGIVAEHGGRLHAESQPGQGATFIMELPVNGQPEVSK
jgi:PAS domain S-box-containing protein